MPNYDDIPSDSTDVDQLICSPQNCPLIYQHHSPGHIKSLLVEFFQLLDIEEVSDNGRVFNPNTVSSVRVFYTARLNKILAELSTYASSPW